MTNQAPLYPQPEPKSATPRLPRAAWFGIGGLGLGALALAGWLLVGPLDLQAQSRDLVNLRQVTPDLSQLHVQSPAKVGEGEPFELALGWRNLPEAASVEPQTLSLRWQDTSYDGKPLKQQLELSLGQTHQRNQVIFQSPGPHRIEVLGPDGSVWKTLDYQVTPYLASIYPTRWEEFRDLPQTPERYHIWVNMQYDPKAPNAQRQHLTITQDNRILQRLLVSSGALASMTPTGSFSLGFKDYYPRSAKYNNTPMPFWSAINVPGHPGEFGFHALEDGGYQWLLGRPASHGCIRMSSMASVETDPKTGVKSWGNRGGARWIYDRIPKASKVTLFRHKLAPFAFEDYERWQIRLAREAQQAAKAKQAAKALKTAKAPLKSEAAQPAAAGQAEAANQPG